MIAPILQRSPENCSNNDATILTARRVTFLASPLVKGEGQGEGSSALANKHSPYPLPGEGRGSRHDIAMTR